MSKEDPTYDSTKGDGEPKSSNPSQKIDTSRIFLEFPDLSREEYEDNPYLFLEKAIPILEKAMSDMDPPLPNQKEILKILKSNCDLIVRQLGICNIEKPTDVEYIQSKFKSMVGRVNDLSSVLESLPQELIPLVTKGFLLEESFSVLEKNTNTLTELFEASIANEESLEEKLKTLGLEYDKLCNELDATKGPTIGNSNGGKGVEIHLSSSSSKKPGCLKYGVIGLTALFLLGITIAFVREKLMNEQIRQAGLSAIKLAEKANQNTENVISSADKTAHLLERSGEFLRSGMEGGSNSLYARLHSLPTLLRHLDKEQSYLRAILFKYLESIEAKITARQVLISLKNKELADKLFSEKSIVYTAESMEIFYIELAITSYLCKTYREQILSKMKKIKSILDKNLPLEERAKKIEELMNDGSENKTVSDAQKFAVLDRLTNDYIDGHTTLKIEHGKRGVAYFRRIWKESTNTTNHKDGISDDDFEKIMTTGEYSDLKGKLLTRSQYNKFLDNMRSLIKKLPKELLVNKNLFGRPISSFEEYFRNIMMGSKYGPSTLHRWGAENHAGFTKYVEAQGDKNDEAYRMVTGIIDDTLGSLTELSDKDKKRFSDSKALAIEIDKWVLRGKESYRDAIAKARGYKKEIEKLNEQYGKTGDWFSYALSKLYNTANRKNPSKKPSKKLKGHPPKGGKRPYPGKRSKDFKKRRK